MKQWENAEIDELNIKSTLNDEKELGYDGPIMGANGETLPGMGTVEPDASGNIGSATYYDKKKKN